MLREVVGWVEPFGGLRINSAIPINQSANYPQSCGGFVASLLNPPYGFVFPAWRPEAVKKRFMLRPGSARTGSHSVQIQLCWSFVLGSRRASGDFSQLPCPSGRGNSTGPPLALEATTHLTHRCSQPRSLGQSRQFFTDGDAAPGIEVGSVSMKETPFIPGHQTILSLRYGPSRILTRKIALIKPKTNKISMMVERKSLIAITP